MKRKASTWQHKYLSMFNLYILILRLKLSISNSIQGSVSWKWVIHRTKTRESSVSTWSLVNHFLPCLSFPLPTSCFAFSLSYVEGSNVSLYLFSTKHSCAPHALRPWGTKCTMEDSTVHLTGSYSAILSHACTVHCAVRSPAGNQRTVCRTGHYSEWISVAEFLQLFTFHQHLRVYKKQEVLWHVLPCMNTHREGAHTPP